MATCVPRERDKYVYMVNTYTHVVQRPLGNILKHHKQERLLRDYPNLVHSDSTRTIGLSWSVAREQTIDSNRLAQPEIGEQLLLIDL